MCLITISNTHTLGIYLCSIRMNEWVVCMHLIHLNLLRSAYIQSPSVFVFRLIIQIFTVRTLSWIYYNNLIHLIQKHHPYLKKLINKSTNDPALFLAQFRKWRIYRCTTFKYINSTIFDFVYCCYKVHTAAGYKTINK